ncbi:hypothetical protein QBC32DRAFT_212919, partial [Pseudoneurospora amorphoporcata]
ILWRITNLSAQEAVLMAYLQLQGPGPSLECNLTLSPCLLHVKLTADISTGATTQRCSKAKPVDSIPSHQPVTRRDGD